MVAALARHDGRHTWGNDPHVALILSSEVKAVYDDIKQARQVDDVNNLWKYIAQHPPTLARTWDSLKDVMAPGALDPLIKELLYVAVSVTNNCG